MIDPISLGLLGLSSAVQAGTGIAQTIRSKNILKNLQRPVYEIPKEATEALNTARTLASTNQLPNQVQAEQAIDQSTANALYNINQNATSGTEALAALTGVYGNDMAAKNQLSGNAANFAQSQNQNLMNQLNQYASYRDKAFDYNKNQPYQQAAMAAQALGGAGMQNTFNALKDASGIALMAGLGQNKNPTTDTNNVAAQIPTNNVMGDGTPDLGAELKRQTENLTSLGGNQGIMPQNDAAAIDAATQAAIAASNQQSVPSFGSGVGMFPQFSGNNAYFLNNMDAIMKMLKLSGQNL